MSSACSPTPATSSTAKRSGSTASPASTSSGLSPLASASYRRDRARSRAWRRVRRLGTAGGGGPEALTRSDPGEVLAAPGVDLDAVAGVDEKGHGDHQARLEGGGLAGPRHPVALDPGLGLGDGQLDG